MNNKGFTKEQLAALKHGDEVALWYGGRYDAHWRVYRIERRTDATIWLTDGRRARASDGKVVGESYKKIWPITDDIRAAIRQCDELAEVRRLLTAADRIVNNHRDPQLVSDLLAVLSPLRERLKGKS